MGVGQIWGWGGEEMSSWNPSQVVNANHAQPESRSMLGWKPCPNQNQESHIHTEICSIVRYS